MGTTAIGAGAAGIASGVAIGTGTGINASAEDLLIAMTPVQAVGTGAARGVFGSTTAGGIAIVMIGHGEIEVAGISIAMTVDSSFAVGISVKRSRSGKKPGKRGGI